MPPTTEKCVNRSLCWGSDYPCDDCTQAMYDPDVAMAKFDNLIARIKDAVGELCNLRSSLKPPTKEE